MNALGGMNTRASNKSQAPVFSASIFIDFLTPDVKSLRVPILLAKKRYENRIIPVEDQRRIWRRMKKAKQGKSTEEKLGYLRRHRRILLPSPLNTRLAGTAVPFRDGVHDHGDVEAAAEPGGFVCFEGVLVSFVRFVQGIMSRRRGRRRSKSE